MKEKHGFLLEVPDLIFNDYRSRMSLVTLADISPFQENIFFS